jgi:subtilase family serine protease
LETRQLLSTGGVASSAASTSVQPFVQAFPLAGGGSSAYSPQQIASAYGISGLSFSGVSGNGAGQTIAIVEAYHDPNIQADLAAFDAHFGLSAPPSFTVDNLGATATDAGWSLETSLDVEWAHAVAPKANIVLVEAPDSSLSSLLNAVRTAASLPNVSVVSMSWGTSEFYGEWNYANLFNTPAGHNGVTFIAASGDSGAWSGPSFPSVSPNVLAVGGTTLTLGSGNSYGSESGWTYSTGGFSGLDNGFWYGFSVPSYQVSTLNSAGLNYGLRTTPDVSFNADHNAGFGVYDSVPYSGASGWFDVGGTSAAAPAWAGLVAITDQGLAASGKSTLTTTQLLGNLYSLPSSDFHDVTAGFNGYQAGTGYDLVTGLGTPQANRLVPGLLAANGVKPTSGTTTTTATSLPAATSTVHKAVVITASTTPSASVATATATPSANFSSGLSALPSQSPTSSTTAASSGATAQASTPASFSGASSAAAIGLGQGTSPASVPASSAAMAATEEPASVIDVIDTGNNVDSGTRESPMPATRTPEMPISEPLPPDEMVPEAVPGTSPEAAPVIPSSNSLDSTIRGVDAGVPRLVAWAPSARIECEREPDEGHAATVAGEGRSVAPSLVAAVGVVALGQRVVIGRDRRTRTLSSLVRSNGR